MYQSVKLTDAIWFLQLVISSPLIHALVDPIQAPPGFEPRASGWKADDLPPEQPPPPPHQGSYYLNV